MDLNGCGIPVCLLVNFRWGNRTSPYVCLYTLWSCYKVMEVGGESEKGVGWW
jgi:hypothetical protein